MCDKENILGVHFLLNNLLSNLGYTERKKTCAGLNIHQIIQILPHTRNTRKICKLQPHH